MTSSRQRRRLGRQSPCLPLSSAMNILALKPLPSSSIIAAAILSSGYNATMHTLVGEEGGTPALVPASPVKIEPASATAGEGGTRSLLQLLWGGRAIPPPPLAANQRTPWRRRQHGGEQLGRVPYGASQCGPQTNAVNLFLRLFLYQFLHTVVL